MAMMNPVLCHPYPKGKCSILVAGPYVSHGGISSHGGDHSVRRTLGCPKPASLLSTKYGRMQRLHLEVSRGPVTACNIENIVFWSSESSLAHRGWGAPTTNPANQYASMGSMQGLPYPGLSLKALRQFPPPCANSRPVGSSDRRACSIRHFLMMFRP